MDPTTEERRALGRQAGAARWVYNYVLAEWQSQQAVREKVVANQLRRLRHLVVLFASRSPSPTRVTARAWSKKLSPKWRLRYLRALQSPSWMAIHKQVTQLKKQPETAWLKEVSAYVVREATKDVGDAYQHFFRRLKKHAHGDHGECSARKTGGCNLGEPTFRGRHDPSGKGFRVAQPEAVDVIGDRVKVAGVGEIRLKEKGYFPQKANYRGLSCREIASRWYVAIQVEEPLPVVAPRIEGKRVGIEVGVRVLAATSDGKSFGAIRDLKNLHRAQRKLALWQRRMARRYKAGTATRDQSGGWQEAVKEVQARNSRIGCIRRDTLHQTSTRIVRSARAETLVMRDMQVRKMISKAGKKTREDQRTRNVIAPMIQEVGMYELRRQVSYKQGWAGGDFVAAGNDYPSTRRCSVCEVVRDDEPGYPDFSCRACGHREDRESNSSKNLRDFATTGLRPGGGETGGGARRRKAPNGGQRPVEPESSGGGSNVTSSSPDGDGISALGPGNRAVRLKGLTEKGAGGE